MGLGSKVRKPLYKYLRQDRRGSKIIYSVSTYLYWLVSARRIYAGTRIVEIPWVLNQLRNHTDDSERILQVWDVLLKKALDKYEVELVDLDAEESAGLGLKVYKDDIRNVCLPKCYFDIAISISVLEHIGLQGPKFPDGDRLAIDIISQALKPDGLLFFSVPFGKPVVMETFRVYDAVRLKWLMQDRFTVIEESYLVWNGFVWQKKSCPDAERVGFLKSNPSMNRGVTLIKAKKANH